MEINSSKIISFLILVSLPFANITKIIGIEDGFSLVTIFLLWVFLLINFFQNFKINFFSNTATIVFLILILAILINLFFNKIIFFDALSNIFKISIFILLIDFIKKNNLVFQYFLLNYHKVYLFSLLISLPLYFVFPSDEFVFYDGSSRFGGLHFELFNFLFSTCLFFISWAYSGKNIKLGLFIALLLMYFAKSNIFYLYIIVFFFTLTFKRFFVNKYISYISVFLIILSPVAIGFFLELLNFLNILAVREVTSFSHTGSSLYSRLYPFSLAVQHIIESGWSSFVPMGLGYFQNSDLVINDVYSYGGTGSPKAMVDLGIILFLLLLLFIAKTFYNNIKYNNFKYLDSSSKNLYLLLFFSTLVYISFGSGFFNIVGWFCILSSSNFLKKSH